MVFPGVSDGKESACNAGDLGSLPGVGRSPGGEHAALSNILAWRIPMDRGAWQASVHGVTKSQTRLKKRSTQHNKIYPCMPLFHHFVPHFRSFLASKVRP